MVMGPNSRVPIDTETVHVHGSLVGSHSREVPPTSGTFTIMGV